MPNIIQTKTNVLGGMPVIRGTRIPVARVMALVGMNYSIKDMQKEMPHLAMLTKQNISEILDFYQNKFVQKNS